MPRLASPRSCLTCRRRKVKCDEALPTCARCVKAGYRCDRTSKFVFKQLPVGEAVSARNNPRKHLQEPHIAELFHVYLKDLAPWYDLNGPSCAFAQEAATLALDDMLLFSAIIALAGCYSARRFSSSPALAEEYHEQCLQLLINLSPSEKAVQHGTALATTCLLRSYEIMSEDTDPNRHLFGASTLLPPEAPNLLDGSLLASGFWNYLREDITYSLIHSCPLKIKTDYPSQHVSERSSLSNIMTLFLAYAVNLHFNKQDDHQHSQTLSQDIDICWQRNQPRPFAYHDLDSDAFPVIKMVSDTEVAASHYYKVAKCIMSTNHRSILAAEVCGLAISSMSDAVVVNAYGPICFVGRWLEKVSQKNMLVKWLHESQKRTAWNVRYVIESLKRAWVEEGNNERPQQD